VKIAVFLPNWVGDMAMATPVLRALRNHFGPDARLLGVGRPYLAPVLHGTTWLDDYVDFHSRSKDRSVRMVAVTQALRREGVDTVVLLTNTLRTGLMAYASGAKQRVGFVRYGRGPLLTHKLYFPRYGLRRLPTPAIDSYLQLASALGCPRESPRLELGTTAHDETVADAVWEKHRLGDDERVVVLNSGGAYGPAKHWPSEYFALLARRVVADGQHSVLVTCGPNERDVARRIVALAGHPRVVSLADEPVSIGLTKACVRRSSLMVTTDSGPRFFGVAFGVPLVTLFGPTDMRWSLTHYAGETCLQHAVPCGPCGARDCPKGHHDCMRLLDVERVYRAVRARLGMEPSHRSSAA
jgi:heptosyltransferase-2